MIRLHILQHVEFESAAYIETYATEKGFVITKTEFFKNSTLPPIDSFDWLIIVGGPMNIYEEQKFPWLAEEKKFLKRVIDTEKVVVGICLGAQLLADALGGTVRKNQYKEIGWFPVHLTKEARQSPLLDGIPEMFLAFHWHGDTFSLPESALRIAFTEGCQNQGFIWNNRVVALQFHFEVTETTVDQLMLHGKNEFIEERFIQEPEQIRDGSLFYINEVNRHMKCLLNNLLKNKSTPAN